MTGDLTLMNTGTTEMTVKDHELFMDLHETSKLVEVEMPGYMFASLALGAEKELSGKILEWGEDGLLSHRPPV
jgi:hypothetical protein